MSKFFDPKSADGTSDRRLYAPATGRNRDVILEVLKLHHPGHGTLLEVASGTGEHAAHMADHFEAAFWQPTDIEPDKIGSMNAWRSTTAQQSMLEGQLFNVLEHEIDALSLPAPLTTVFSANLIHIAPWVVAEALVSKAGTALSEDGILFLYGPFKRGGLHTSTSNESFDQSLKARDTAWGVRDLEAVEDLAAAAGFASPTIVEMPANNLSVIFKKA